MRKNINVSYQITMSEKEYEEMKWEIGAFSDSDIETFFKMIIRSSGGKENAMKIQIIDVSVTDDENLN